MCVLKGATSQGGYARARLAYEPNDVWPARLHRVGQEAQVVRRLLRGGLRGFYKASP